MPLKKQTVKLLLCFTNPSFALLNAARKGLVAPVPRGGEEEAQEEASRTES